MGNLMLRVLKLSANVFPHIFATKIKKNLIQFLNLKKRKKDKKHYVSLTDCGCYWHLTRVQVQPATGRLFKQKITLNIKIKLMGILLWWLTKRKRHFIMLNLLNSVSVLFVSSLMYWYGRNVSVTSFYLFHIFNRMKL